MTIIGFDPGSNSFGIGILQKNNNLISYLYSEEIKFDQADFYTRMKTLWQRLEDIYNRFPNLDAAIEEGYLGKNVKSMNVVALVRGVVLGSLIAHNIPLTFYSPRTIKQALTGSGAALKPQVESVVKILLKLKDKKLGPDESDALAIAYCHILQLRSKPKP